MTKYKYTGIEWSFTSPSSEEYKENWERTFGKQCKRCSIIFSKKEGRVEVNFSQDARGVLRTLAHEGALCHACERALLPTSNGDLLHILALDDKAFLEHISASLPAATFRRAAQQIENSSRITLKRRSELYYLLADRIEELTE